MATTKNGWTMTRDTTTGNYTLEKSVTANGDQTILVKCGNKNMTGDVRVNIGVSVPTGITPTGTITIVQKTGTNVTNYASANVQDATISSPVATKGAVSSNKVIITPKVEITGAGWIASGTITGSTIEVTAAELVSGTKTISASGVQDCKTYASVNVPAGSAKVNNSTIVPTISQSGNKITVNGSTTSSGTVTTAGWVTSITSGTASIQTTTYTIPAGELANVGTTGVTYTENTDPATVLPKNGALYINAGYYGNTKITLGHLIPDPTAPYEDPGSGDMRSGFVAFDSEGNEIIGTMAEVTPTFSGGTPSLTGKTSSATTTMATVNSSTYYVNVQSSAKATRTTVSYGNNYTGYIDKASGTQASAAATEASAETVANTTVYIKAGTITNNTTGGTSSGTINRGKQIKIDQGYYGSTLYYQAQSNSGTKTITANGATTCDGYATVDIQVPTGITPTGSTLITQQNGQDVTNFASVNVRSATYGATLSKTLSGTQVIVTPSVSVDQSGWVQSGKTGTSVVINATDFGSGVITPSIGNSGLDTYFDNGTSTTYSVALTPQYINSAGYVSAHTTAQSGTIIYKKIKQGTEGSPIAEKGTVSGNKVVITPKVTNTGGWIAGGTITGSTIEVTAAELVSGTLTPTSSGTKDCKTYASVNVRNATTSVSLGSSSVTNNQITITPVVTVDQSGWIASAKTGTAIIISASDLVSGSTVITHQIGTDVTNYANADVQEATPSFTGGVASITDPTSTYTTNMIENSTSTYFINVQVSAKATRSTVSYDGAVSGWVEKANGAQASAATTSAESLVTGVTIGIHQLTLTTATTTRSSTDYPTSARVETLGRTVSTRYILIPEGYHPTKQYYQISGVSNGSWSGPTTTAPSSSYLTTVKTVTPSAATQYVTISGGYISSRSVKINSKYDTEKTMSVSTTAKYFIAGKCILRLTNGSNVSEVALENTYLQVYSITQGTDSDVLIYKLPYSSISDTSAISSVLWSSYNLEVSKESGTTATSSITLHYDSDATIVYTCSTSQSSKTFTSTTTSVTQDVNQNPNRLILYVYTYTTAGYGSMSRYTQIHYPFMQILSISVKTASQQYSVTAESVVNFKYSTDGINWTTGSNSCYNSSSSGSSKSASATIMGYYYAFTGIL